MRFKHICFLCWGILSSCAPKAIVDPVAINVPEGPEPLVTIANEVITAEEFLYTVTKNQHLKPKKKELLTQEEFDQNFELFLNFKLKVKEAENRGMDKTEEFLNEFQMIKDDLKKPYLLKNSIQEGELRKSYSRSQEILKASHLLLEFPPNANQNDSVAVLRMAEKLKEKADSGADFNELAYLHSDDPSAKFNKGNLGYFTALQMVYPFEDAAYGLEVGEISAPVLTDFGYHIIKLVDRRPNPGEIKVSHILIRVEPDNPLSEDRAKRRIAEIYTVLQNKTSPWEEVVKSYSEDLDTKDRGGELPWFGVGTIVPEFEEAAFSLRALGEISRPVKTPYGFHIIRLEERKPVASYEEMESVLRSKILRDSRSGLIQSQVSAMQMAKYNFQENEPVVAALKPFINRHYAEGKLGGFSSFATMDLIDSVLFIIPEDTFLVRSFVEFLETEDQIQTASSGSYFDPLYTKYKEISLDAKEEQDLLENNLEYNLLVREYREGILLFSIMNELVWQKALMDSAGQEEYYKAHIYRYQWPDRVQALLVKMSDDSQLPKVRRFLADKTYHKNLRPRLEDQFLNDYPMLFTLEEGLFTIEENAILRKIDLEAKSHELVHEGQRYFVLVGEIIPAGPKTFEESRGKVIQDYQKQLDHELIAKLKESYSIQINPSEKERISDLLVEK